MNYSKQKESHKVFLVSRVRLNFIIRVYQIFEMNITLDTELTNRDRKLRVATILLWFSSSSFHFRTRKYFVLEQRSRPLRTQLILEDK